MENYKLLIIVGAVVLLFIILKFIIKKVTALIIVMLAVICILFGMYFLGIGPFKTSINIYKLKERFCVEQKDNKCECIVKPMIDDFEARIPEEKREVINNDKIKSLIEVSKSFKNILPQAKACLLQRNAEREMIDFVSEVFKFDISNFSIDQIKNDIDSLIVK